MSIKCKLFGCKHSLECNIEPIGVRRYRYPARSARKLQFLFAIELTCERCNNKTVKLKWLDDEVSLRNRFSTRELTGKDDFDE